MPVQYVTIPVTITARVDARYDRYGDLEVSEISSVAIDDVNISLDAMPQDVRDCIKELASEAAYEKDEWHE